MMTQLLLFQKGIARPYSPRRPENLRQPFSFVGESFGDHFRLKKPLEKIPYYHYLGRYHSALCTHLISKHVPPGKPGNVFA